MVWSEFEEHFVSKKKVLQSLPGVSIMNLMSGPTEFKWFKSVSLFFVSYAANISHISFPPRGRYGALRAYGFFFKVFHVNVGNEWRDGGNYCSSFDLLVEFLLEGEDTVVEH